MSSWMIACSKGLSRNRTRSGEGSSWKRDDFQTSDARACSCMGKALTTPPNVFKAASNCPPRGAYLLASLSLDNEVAELLGQESHEDRGLTVSIGCYAVKSCVSQTGRVESRSHKHGTFRMHKGQRDTCISPIKPLQCLSSVLVYLDGLQLKQSQLDSFRGEEKVRFTAALVIGTNQQDQGQVRPTLAAWHTFLGSMCRSMSPAPGRYLA